MALTRRRDRFEGVAHTCIASAGLVGCKVLLPVAIALCLFSAASAAPASDSQSTDSVIKLTKYNFDDNVKNGDWFIKFFAPWCTHCKRMKPVWDQLADRGSNQDWSVKIAEVDCTTSKDVCDRAQIKAFPTLALISNGVLKAKYAGEATVEHFEEFLTEQAVLKASGVSTSTGETIVQSGTGASGKRITATGWTAMCAVFNNIWADVLKFLATWPTRHKITNVYFYGAVTLVVVVVVLYLLNNMVLEEERRQEEREKSD